MGDAVATGAEPFLEALSGTAVQWTDAAHNLCERRVAAKQQRGKKGRKRGGRDPCSNTKTVVEKTPSFFHFFDPPSMPDDENATGMDEAMLEAVSEALQVSSLR